MQVDQKPSVWPCVAMLVTLLLFCVTVPHYWRHDSAALSPKPIVDARKLAPPSRADLDFDIATNLPFGVGDFSDLSFAPNDGQTDNDLVALWGPPTIEELITAHVGSSRVGESSIGWPVFQPTLARTSEIAGPVRSAGVAAAAMHPRVRAALARAGRWIADYSWTDALPRLCDKLAPVYQIWSSQLAEPKAAGVAPTPARAASLPVSTLRVLRPNDRLAMNAPLVENDNSHAPQTTPCDPWCVPQALFEQLERLACHPDTSQWAQHPIRQLRAVTERNRLERGDVQTILAELSGSAQEALRRAEETGEDRLRVELLRAHWGLARRLDCWGAAHDVHEASRLRERVASRDSLGSFFENPGGDVVEATDVPALAVDLEAYEQTRNPRVGRQVVREQRSLNASPDSLDRALAEAVEQHYRNANVRIAITAEMLNRLVAAEQSEVSPLRERIAGTPVRGRSHTQSESRVRLDAAAGRWQLGVEAEGMVKSDTLADGGRARLRSHSATDFVAHKTILVDPNGVQLQRSVVDAATHNRLVAVTTDFDWMPLFGSYARNRAIEQYRARRARAAAEVEFRVSSQAADRIDRETLEAVKRIERQIRKWVTDRLAEVGVELTPVEMTTTPERLVGRFRVAGEHQLGSHTPRPRALSDSLASVQCHESALTNAAVSLALDGRRCTAPELRAHLREKFPRMAAENATEARRDAVFHFAAEDAVQFHIDGGRLELTLALASIEQEGRVMRNFLVHAYYVPVVSGLEAELVRDGTLGIEGRLSSAERARLHNVFNSVLPPDRSLPIARLEDPNDPRLAGLMITQLVLEDGWLGLAVGPTSRERVAERSRSLR